MCTVECGFACELKTNGPDVCLSECGDGHLASDEECDDDNVFDAMSAVVRVRLKQGGL